MLLQFLDPRRRFSSSSNEARSCPPRKSKGVGEVKRLTGVRCRWWSDCEAHNACRASDMPKRIFPRVIRGGKWVSFSMAQLAGNAKAVSAKGDASKGDVN